MLGHLFVVLGQVGTLFLLMGVGYVLGRKKWLNQEGTAQMSTLLLYIVAPCIIIRALQIDRTPELLSTLGTSAVIMAGSYLLFIAGSFLLFRRQPPDRQVVLRFGGIYGNVGFMGLPLIQAALGQEAVLLCVVGIVIFNIFQWSHGATVMGGKASLQRMILNPGTVAVAVGMAFYLASVRLPDPALKAVGYLADLNTPLAMVVIGAQMSGVNIKTTFSQPALYGSAAVKLLLAPTVTAALLLPLRLDFMLYCVCVVLAATPTAGMTSIFAQRFERDTATAAQLVTLTTLLSAFTLPVFLVLAQRLAG